MVKTCKKCSIEKPLEEYYNKKMGKFGKDSLCKLCAAIRSVEGRQRHYEKRRAKEREYKIANREKIRESGRIYDQKNKEKIAERKREYRKNNQDKLSAQKREYRSKPEIKARDREYLKKRRQADPLFKLIKNARSRLGNYLRSTSLNYDVSAIRDLGCEKQDLKKYIESKFETWMTWENYGPYNPTKDTWHLDHIISLSTGKTKEQIKKLCHYTNLQPLKAINNLRKNKY